jgi:hypothetical protein
MLPFRLPEDLQVLMDLQVPMVHMHQRAQMDMVVMEAVVQIIITMVAMVVAAATVLSEELVAVVQTEAQVALVEQAEHRFKQTP